MGSSSSSVPSLIPGSLSIKRLSQSSPVSAVVTGVGSTIGLGVAKALRLASFPVRIIGADSDPLSVGLYSLDSTYHVPRGSDDMDGYTNALLAICKKEGASIIFSGWDGELLALGAQAERFLHEAGTCIGHRTQGIEAASDKWLTFVRLTEAGVACPATVLASDHDAAAAFIDRYGFPLIMKPRRGAGSRGVVTVKTMEDVRFFSSYLRDPVIQEELLPAEEEYTVGVFRYEDGRFGGTLSLRRSLMSGLSYRMEVVDVPAVSAIAQDAIAALGIVGAANVQLRLTPQGPRVFEVNPRFSSSTSVRAAFGFNEPELAIRHFVFGECPAQPTIERGFCLRYWEEMFLPPSANALPKEGNVSCRGVSFPVVDSGWSSEGK